MRSRSSVLILCLTMAACSREGRIAKTSARAPATRVAPVTDTMHGVQITDRYRWLEGDNSDPNEPGRMTPEVSAWTDAQNSYTRSVLDNLPGRKALEDRLAALMNIGSVTAPIVRGNRYFFWNREATQPLPILYWREGALGADNVLDRRDGARSIRQHDRRMVRAVRRRQAPRVRLVSRR